MSNRKSITFLLNQKQIEDSVDTNATLAEYLRENLGLTGVKIGCNRGECGSCTVLLDEEAVYSCSVLAVDVSGRNVITVEGLMDHNNLHPLQEAFLSYDALQCGFCTPGMLMSLIALLNKNPNPSEEDIIQAIDGNLCRCGCYPNIVKATQEVSRQNSRLKEAGFGDE